MFMVGCFVFLRRGQLEGRTNTLSRAKQTALFLLTLIMCLFLQAQPSWSATALYGAFTGSGIWGYNGANWTQVTPNTPTIMAATGSTLYGAFAGGGIWQWNGSTWTQVTPNTPTIMAATGSTLYGAFTGGGIWQWNGSTWSQVTPNTPTIMAVTGTTLYGAFTGSGIWQWNGSSWSQVTPNTPTIMTVSGSILYGAFTGGGIWQWNGSTWSQVTPNTPTIMAVSGSTLYGAFTGGGIWQWNGSTWTQVTPNTPTIMAVTGTTLYGAFTGSGIWQWNGSSWSQVTPNTPTIMTVASTTTTTLADLAGTWVWHCLSSGSENAWIHATLTVNSSGEATVTSCQDSAGGSMCPPSTIQFTVDSNGVISISGGGAPSTERMTMTLNKNFIAGTGDNASNPSTRSYFDIMQKVVPGTTYRNADVQNLSFVGHYLWASKTYQPSWEYTTNTTNANGVINITSDTTSSGPGTPPFSSPGTFSVDSSGNVTLSGDANFHGFLSDDKKTIVATDTSNGWGSGSVYALMIFQVTGQTYTAGKMPVGTWTQHFIAEVDFTNSPDYMNNPYAFWVDETITVASGGIYTYSNATTNLSGHTPSSGGTAYITSSGTITTSDNLTLNGQMSYDGTFCVSTDTAGNSNSNSDHWYMLSILTK
jgi:hypothetical protein